MSSHAQVQQTLYDNEFIQIQCYSLYFHILILQKEKKNHVKQTDKSTIYVMIWEGWVRIFYCNVASNFE